MILVVGAGLSGLACALRLEAAGRDWMLVEASPEPGGRVATEVTTEGFRLDRGFQVLLDSYPTARRLLDFKALQPRYFQSGALLAGKDRHPERLLNPLRHVGGIRDALRARFPLREKLMLGAYTALQTLRSDRSLLTQECGWTALEELKRLCLSGEILESFLRPFFAGVFLDNELGTDASLLRYDLKKFTLGRALLPDRGMRKIPRQLASRLPAERLRYASRISSLQRSGDRVSGVVLEGGEVIPCDQLVLATDEQTTRRLLGLPAGRAWTEVTTLYFTGGEPLYKGALLVLPSGSSRLVRHFTDLTSIAPGYAPPGRRLLSATILGSRQGDSADAAKAEIAALFPEFRKWEFLKEVRVRHALPSQRPGFGRELLSRRPLPNLVLAGDQVACASIESALVSGGAAAEELLKIT